MDKKLLIVGGICVLTGGAVGWFFGSRSGKAKALAEVQAGQTGAQGNVAPVRSAANG